jgi:hypothetical protein
MAARYGPGTHLGAVRHAIVDNPRTAVPGHARSPATAA